MKYRELIISLSALIGIPIWYLSTSQLTDPLYGDVIIFGYVINSFSPIPTYVIIKKIKGEEKN